MNCIQVQEALSQGIDDGTPVSDAVAAHVARCAACTEWRDGAHHLARRLLVPVPGDSKGLPTGLPVPRWFWALRAARYSLGWIGVLLIVRAVPNLFATGVDVTLIHLSRHQNAFSMALGASFLFVAWRPDRAYGMVPVAVVFSIAIAGATVDLINGASTFERESIHIVEVVGLLIVWALGVSAGPGASERRTRKAGRLRSVGDD